MALRGTDPESYMTESTLVYEDSDWALGFELWDLGFWAAVLWCFGLSVLGCGVWSEGFRGWVQIEG